YRQRVGLAQALLGDPEVLILDEPTIGLDPRQITEIRALIKSLGGQHTVILSTHILPEVSMVCDSVIIINRGRIVAQGTQAGLVAAGAASDRSLSRGSLHPCGGGRRSCAPDRGSRGGGGAVMGWLPVFKKEMRLYFGSPVAYAVATFFLFVTAFFFVPAFRGFADLSMRAAMQPQMGGDLNATETILRPLIYNIAAVLLSSSPMVPVRLIAEHR